MELSEFEAKDNITVHIKDKLPSSNVEGAKEILIKKGEKIPKAFIPSFLLYNRDYIANLMIKDGIPQLTKEQEKEYGVSFPKPTPITFKQEIDKIMKKYTMEDLHEKIAEKGADGFKKWAENKFGKDKIDRRKSCKKIVVDILNLQ